MAVAIPADLDRHLGVRHRLDADVIAGTIVDLLVRPLVDVQYRDQTTADGQPMRGDLPAAERQLLAHTGLQQVPIDLITRVAGTELISVSELQIVTVGKDRKSTRLNSSH